jgi:hypothetical protein
MNSWYRKIIIKMNLIDGFFDKEIYSKKRINDFKVDNNKNLMMFSYKRHPTVIIYSYSQRKVVQELEVYNPKLLSKFFLKKNRTRPCEI